MSALTAAHAQEAQSQTPEAAQLSDATRLVEAFRADPATAIPDELFARARGIAVLPGVIRGGFVIGGRRGRGVLSVRLPDGGWSMPAFVTLTGGSIGWQFGAESADIVLVFANDNAVRNIARGKFTLAGDATAVAGPVGRRATSAVTFRAEVYSYLRSRGLFAGAALEGARLALDEDAADRFYASGGDALEAPVGSAPAPVTAFIEALGVGPEARPEPASEEGDVRTFPLGP